MSESPRQEADDSTDSGNKEFACDSCGKAYGTRGGLAYHMRKCSPSDMVKCEFCSKLLLSEKSIRNHEAQSHDIGRVKKECQSCGEEFEVKRYREDTAKYCSDACRTRDTVAGWNKKQHPTLECERCGDDYTVKPYEKETSRYCSIECKHGPRPTVECSNCGRDYEVARHKKDSTKYCSIDCRDEDFRNRFSGEDSPRWKGGKVHYYGENWIRKRKQTLERDEYQCQHCRTSEDLHVHHIRKIRKFDEPEDANYLENLVTLCAECHRAWEGIPLRPYLL